MRYLAGGLFLVLVLGLAAAAGVTWQFQYLSRERLVQHYRQDAAIVDSLQGSRMQELQLRARTLATDPAFVDYVAQSLEPNPQLGGGVDSASINNLLEERRKGYDMAAVLDASGHLVTRSGMPLRSTTDFSRDPLVRRVMQTRKPASGLWSGQGALTRVAVDPLLRGGVLQGVLIAATRVRASLARDVARITRSRVAMVVPAGQAAAVPLSSGIDPVTLSTLNANSPDVLDDSDGARMLRLPVDGGMARAWVQPIVSSDGRAALVLLAPGARVDRWRVPHEAHVLLAGVALLTAIGVGIVLLLYLRTYQPMDDMRRILRRAASGETGITLRTGGNQALRRLRDVINGVLDRHAT